MGQKNNKKPLQGKLKRRFFSDLSKNRDFGQISPKIRDA
jgi:hypothetical protein